MSRLVNISCIVIFISLIFLAPVHAVNPSYSAMLSADLKNSIDNYIGERNFSELEKNISFYLKEKSEKNSLTLDVIYNYIAQAPDILGFLDAWCSESSQSSIPFTIRGLFYINYAWDARGSGYAHTVSDSSYKLFKERLLQAKKDLELAYSKNPSDGNAPASLIRVAMGLNLGREYMETQFKNAVTADPFNYKAYSAKLEYLMPRWHGSKEEVTNFVNEIKRIAPEGSRLRLLTVTFYSRLYDDEDLYNVLKQDKIVWSKIQNEFQGYLTIHPEDILAHNKFCQLAFYAGRYEIAMREFEIIGENADEYIWTKGMFHVVKTLSKAYCLIDSGDWRAAEDVLSANHRVRGFEYIIIRFWRYKDNAGLELFLNKLKDSGRVAQYHLFKGFFLEKDNKLKEAMAEYNNALRLDPAYSEAYVKAGHIYEKTGDVKQAINFYQKGIDTDPKNAVAYYDLGRIYEDALSQHAKAISLIETAIAADPKNGAWYYLLGKAYENINNHDKCIENWEKYLEMEPDGNFANFVRSFLPKVRAGLTN